VKNFFKKGQKPKKNGAVIAWCERNFSSRVQTIKKKREEYIQQQLAKQSIGNVLVLQYI
jgi:hypothetical protein